LIKKTITKIADIINPDDFYKDIHGMIYESMADLYQNREPIDVVSLSNNLNEKGKLETIGGRSYLASLANMVPSSSHIFSYANIVQKKATLRRLLAAASSIAELGYKETKEVNELLDADGNKICIFKSPTGSGKTLMMAESLKRLIDSRIDGKKFSFVWIAVNKLHDQSRNSLKNITINTALASNAPTLMI